MADLVYISGDSHLEVHPDLWTGRIPAQYQQYAPRVVQLQDGSDGLVIGDSAPRRLPTGDFYGGKGRDNESWGGTGATYGNTPGTGGPEQRIREQDEDGIAAEVLFPGQQTGPRLWRTVRDDAAYLSLVQAWNSWLAKDYCSVDPDRLVGLGVMPWSGIGDAVAELERCAELGLKGIVLGTFPSNQPYPVPEDDRFWARAVELQVPVTVHVELNRGGEQGPLFQYPAGARGAGDGMKGLVEILANPKFAMLGAVNAVQLMFAGVFDRFPSLRIFFAENQIGWIPNFIEQADELYDWHRYVAERSGMALQQMPSEYFRAHCCWGFQYNPVGVELRHHLGVEQAIWATDFPHQGSEWPNSKTRVIDRNFVGVPEHDVYRMVCGNTCEFFHLDEELYRESA